MKVSDKKSVINTRLSRYKSCIKSRKHRLEELMK
jgi:hypothetical protein